MDDSAEWLKPKDLALAVAILEAFPESRRTAVEIGVWKGAWSLGVLENVAGSAVLGVDPYPGISGHKIRSILEERVSVTRVGKRFNLVSGLAMATSCLAGAKPVLVHIDGEHTEAGVGADLSWARQALAPDGIIVVDDYIHSWFPGIASAMHAFLRAEDFRIVLVTESKAYLCHASRHAEWYSRLEHLLHGQSSVLWFHHFGEGGTPRYIQVPDVLGSRVLLVLGEADVLPNEHHPMNPGQAEVSPGEHPAGTSGPVARGLLRRIVRRILPTTLRRTLLRGYRFLLLLRRPAL